MAPPNDKEADQSDSMGRSDDEEEIPMKQPADDGDGGAENTQEADESFLDDDFLSFSNVDNGGGGLNAANGSNGENSKLSGRKRERSPSPMPLRNGHQNNSYPAQYERPTIPWLNNTMTAQKPPPPPQQQQRQEQWGRNRGYNNHSNNNQYYTPPSIRTPPLIRLHNEIVSFVKLMAPTKEELEIRERMVERVTDLAQKIFGGKDKCQVLPFGSQVTGLCLPGSDIDFVIRFPETTSNGASKGKSDEAEKDDEEDDFTKTSNPLHRFADAVRDEFGVRSELEAGDVAKKEEEGGSDIDDYDSSEHLSYLEVIEQTRVPLVKFTVAPYNIDIDVCFQQPNGPESAELMHRFMESMPPLRPLTFVLKYFLASRDINKPFTGGIGSYLLQLMIVSFLQHRSREDMERNCGGAGMHFNLGSLLVDFLELYGVDFNYVTTGISVRHDGYYFPKGQQEMKNVFWQPSRPFSIAMENPLDPTADVGGGAFRIQMISRIFGHAFKTLLAYVSEPLEPTDSILAMIIPPTEEMEKRMACKQDDDVYEAGEDDVSSDDNDTKKSEKGGSMTKEMRKALKLKKKVKKRELRKERKKERRVEKQAQKKIRRDINVKNRRKRNKGENPPK
ncbi:hypothetical protein ACHAXR_010918 [Thalassiosira sp. AJA248-18]